LRGIDGSGKTTQVKFLGDYLASRGYSVVLTREPGGSRVGEAIREILLNPSYKEMDGRTEALLYAAARAQHVFQVILPALREGKVVLCDRFLDSSLAYQGYGRGMAVDQIELINSVATGGLKPDLVVLLDFCHAAGLDRIRKAGQLADRIEQEDAGFYQRVREGFLTLASREPGRYRVIDAFQPVEKVSDEVRKAVEEVLSCGFCGRLSGMSG